MSASAEDAQATVLDRLVESLHARASVAEGAALPAVLWTDPTRDWAGMVDLLRERMDEFFVLGEFDPAQRSGPAVWLRCVVDGALPDTTVPAGKPAILYLPGVKRQDLRAGQECPAPVRPLVELMYRGALWHHANGLDWSVTAFFTSRSALGIEIAGGREAAEALKGALRRVAQMPVAHFATKQWRAEDFHSLTSPDVVGNLLRWLDDPKTMRAGCDEDEWQAFCTQCNEKFSFDPETEADVTAGEKLVQKNPAWQDVWARYTEAPGNYKNIKNLLRRSRPQQSFSFVDDSAKERSPDFNEREEAALRDVFRDVPKQQVAEARQNIARLEKEHSARREWVWSREGFAPMAQALEHLARLAAATSSALGGGTPDELAQVYRERGWRADAAAWEAIAAVGEASDEKLVANVVQHLLRDWLDDSARAFQEALARTPVADSSAARPVEARENECLFFVDGLRFDLAERLLARLEERNLRVQMKQRWAALPTVTATAKPAVTPVAPHISGGKLGEAFEPKLKQGNKPASAANLRAAMKNDGYQIIQGDSFEGPLSPARGWVESGDIDGLGHKLDAARFARALTAELDRIAERVQKLLGAGWESVRIVTDHGWLFLPGGLPKVDLPKHLTDSRWARCAVISGEATPDVPRMPWHWNERELFAAAPGAACFNKTEEYAHGGLSIQECLTPDVRVERAGDVDATVKIRSIVWRRLRCQAELSVQGSGAVLADLRLGNATGQAVTAEQKRVTEGKVSLVLNDDEHEGASLVLVIVDESGRILAQASTRAGENT